MTHRRQGARKAQSEAEREKANTKALKVFTALGERQGISLRLEHCEWRKGRDKAGDIEASCLGSWGPL